MNRLGYILLFVIVLIIAATSSWLLNKVDEQPFALIKPLRHDPDYFLKDFTATIMDINKLPRYSLRGKYLEHFPDDDSTDIVKPHIKFFRDNLPPWKVDADRGHIVEKGKIIYLNGVVTMRRPASKTEMAVQLITSNLKIRTDIEYAVTQEPVTIKTRQHTLRAIGMRVYLAEGRLELLSEVKGQYDTSLP